ncbi:MAG: hypothetical protein GY941_23620 [Planctomycetes bacterium]|nr:hypothetical protein [Planctomycetota bacterium]
MKHLISIIIIAVLTMSPAFAFDRKYSVKEIIELREVCVDIQIRGNPCKKEGTSRPYNKDDVAKKSEDQVRTYMEAGITANDILKEFCATQNTEFKIKTDKPEASSYYYHIVEETSEGEWVPVESHPDDKQLTIDDGRIDKQ